MLDSKDVKKIQVLLSGVLKSSKQKEAAKKIIKAFIEKLPAALKTEIGKNFDKLLSQTTVQKSIKTTLVFQGINHAGPSYEGRVFLNNKRANEKTKTTSANGYAGSFFIFGHGGRCYGGSGHCNSYE
jgi:hypothetical protein